MMCIATYTNKLTDRIKQLRAFEYFYCPSQLHRNTMRHQRIKTSYKALKVTLTIGTHRAQKNIGDEVTLSYVREQFKLCCAKIPFSSPED